jgi:xanthosine utilization system XapX-like protein
MTEISAMKWNTPDYLFGLYAGTLFGIFLAMTIVKTVEPSPDVRSYIGLFGLFGMLAVINVRHRVLRKTPPSSTQS